MIYRCQIVQEVTVLETVLMRCHNICFNGKILKIIPKLSLLLLLTSIKQATCFKQACIQFPKQADDLNVPALSKHLS